ncbi:unnamed protein product [Caenorhabditis sp. 36 PRJEB53466]|nr:unnamed protein product [Caenorhabditis sp. 36 PRJEB53466]
MRMQNQMPNQMQNQMQVRNPAEARQHRAPNQLAHPPLPFPGAPGYGQFGAPMPAPGQGYYVCHGDARHEQMMNGFAQAAPMYGHQQGRLQTLAAFQPRPQHPGYPPQGFNGGGPLAAPLPGHEMITMRVEDSHAYHDLKQKLEMMTKERDVFMRKAAELEARFTAASPASPLDETLSSHQSVSPTPTPVTVKFAKKNKEKRRIPLIKIEDPDLQSPEERIFVAPIHPVRLGNMKIEEPDEESNRQGPEVQMLLARVGELQDPEESRRQSLDQQMLLVPVGELEDPEESRRQSLDQQMLLVPVGELEDPEESRRQGLDQQMLLVPVGELQDPEEDLRITEESRRQGLDQQMLLAPVGEQEEEMSASESILSDDSEEREDLATPESISIQDQEEQMLLAPVDEPEKAEETLVIPEVSNLKDPEAQILLAPVNQPEAPIEQLVSPQVPNLKEMQIHLAPMYGLDLQEFGITEEAALSQFSEEELLNEQEKAEEEMRTTEAVFSHDDSVEQILFFLLEELDDPEKNLGIAEQSNRQDLKEHVLLTPANERKEPEKETATPESIVSQFLEGQLWNEPEKTMKTTEAVLFEDPEEQNFLAPIEDREAAVEKEYPKGPEMQILLAPMYGLEAPALLGEGPEKQASVDNCIAEASPIKCSEVPMREEPEVKTGLSESIPVLLAPVAEPKAPEKKIDDLPQSPVPSIIAPSVTPSKISRRLGRGRGTDEEKKKWDEAVQYYMRTDGYRHAMIRKGGEIRFKCLFDPFVRKPQIPQTVKGIPSKIVLIDLSRPRTDASDRTRKYMEDTTDAEHEDAEVLQEYLEEEQKVQIDAGYIKLVEKNTRADRDAAPEPKKSSDEEKKKKKKKCGRKAGPKKAAAPDDSEESDEEEEKDEPAKKTRKRVAQSSQGPQPKRKFSKEPWEL